MRHLIVALLALAACHETSWASRVEGSPESALEPVDCTDIGRVPARPDDPFMELYRVCRLEYPDAVCFVGDQGLSCIPKAP